MVSRFHRLTGRVSVFTERFYRRRDHLLETKVVEPATTHGIRHAVKLTFWYSLIVTFASLAATVYMIELYNRVPAGGSIETLVVLTAMLLVVTICIGLSFDLARRSIANRIGAMLRERLEPLVVREQLRRDGVAPRASLRDLDMVLRFTGSTLYFIPFEMVGGTTLFVGVLFYFHAWLGFYILAVAVVLIGIAVYAHYSMREPETEATQGTQRTEQLLVEYRQRHDELYGNGMTDAARKRVLTLSDKATVAKVYGSDLSGRSTTYSRTFRQTAQSILIGLGIYLVTFKGMSMAYLLPAMFLFGKALAPIDQAVGGAAMLYQAYKSRQRLSEIERSPLPIVVHTELPIPRGAYDVMVPRGEYLAVTPPDYLAQQNGDVKPTLIIESGFQLSPGESLGIVGPNGSGKSTLLRAMAGIWPTCPVNAISLDLVPLAQYGEQLGRYIGFLPQLPWFFTGTVGENIARLEVEPDLEALIQATKRAGAYPFVSKLPGMFKAKVTKGGTHFSGGQLQQLALARALYGEPSILLLDEPTSHLAPVATRATQQLLADLAGEGRTVILTGHRPEDVSFCDKILVVNNGRVVDFGNRDEIFARRGKAPAQAPALVSA